MAESNNDEVICPNCTHQFRAIPVNVQGRIRELEAALDGAQLRSIEARNPGIDMDEVRRSRAAHSDTADQGEHRG